jgi:TRAP-type C4-dicarboxylate transport system substrate-binding protein
VNLRKWNALSAKTREILQNVAIAHETESLNALQALWKTEEVELTKRGVKYVAQSPDASKRFVDGAVSASLARMKERMEKAGGTENYDQMVKLFVKN